MSNSNDLLTAERLRELLSYDHSTGVFVRKVRSSNSVREGDVAGDPDGHGYLRMRLSGRQYKAHRLAWLYVYGKWPEKEIDHINGIRSDNRIANLREATTAENGQNRALPKNSLSKHHGVGLDRRYGKWRARIKIRGVEFSLGYFKTIEEAVAARAAAKAKLHTFHPVDRVNAQPEDSP